MIRPLAQTRVSLLSSGGKLIEKDSITKILEGASIPYLSIEGNSQDSKFLVSL
jgi:hypothetical protein